MLNPFSTKTQLRKIDTVWEPNHLKCLPIIQVAWNIVNERLIENPTANGPQIFHFLDLSIEILVLFAYISSKRAQKPNIYLVKAGNLKSGLNSGALQTRWNCASTFLPTLLHSHISPFNAPWVNCEEIFLQVPESDIISWTFCSTLWGRRKTIELWVWCVCVRGSDSRWQLSGWECVCFNPDPPHVSLFWWLSYLI